MEMNDHHLHGHARDLKALATANFGKLTDAEELLLEKVPTGEWAVCGPNDDDADPNNNPKHADDWGPGRQIRAELVGWLCMDKDAREHVHGRGIQVYGANVNGPIDLSFVTISFQLSLEHRRLKADIDLSSAEVQRLDLRGSLVGEMSADGVVVKNDVVLDDGFTTVGELRLLGAKIGGNLSCIGGTFTNPPRKGVDGSGKAVNADGIDVQGDVFIRESTVKGEVRLLGARIGGGLDCDGGTFTNPPRKDLDGSGSALNADGVNVKGDIALGGGFAANGGVSLVGAQIGGDLDCEAGTFTNPLRKGIDGSGDALTAERISVMGGVYLRDGFTAHGGIDLDGAQIGGIFDCRNGDFREAIVDLTDAKAASLRDSGLNDVPGGSDADSPPTIWPQRGNLLLDGFFYGRIPSEGRIDVTTRLEWLGLQPGTPFRRQPYLQLARVLRESGDSDGALRVLEQMEQLRRRSEKHGPVGHLWSSIWSWMLKGSIGYGYRPGRAIWLIILLSALGWMVYGSNYQAGTMVPTDKDAYNEFRDPKTIGQVPPQYPSFSAPIYSLENSLPLFKLGQGDKWQPDPGRKGSLSASVRWFLRIQILLGWLLATLFVAGVSGIVHKE